MFLLASFLQQPQSGAYDAGKDTLYRAYLLATIIGVAGAIGGVIVLVRQTILARKSADAAADAARAAKASADAIKAVDRPWLLVCTMSRATAALEGCVSGIAVKWTIKNYGRTPALVEKIESHIDVIPPDFQFPSQPVYEKPLKIFFEEPVVPPDKSTHDILSAMDRAWKSSELSEVSKGNLWHIASGRIVYRDTFGDKHETRFCFRYEAMADAFASPVGPKGYNEYT
jgi:hypothetical protein